MFDLTRIEVRASPQHWLLALLVPMLATLPCLWLQQLLPVPSLAMFYLGAVLLTAVYTGSGPALLAACLSFLAYNFFFTEPHYTLFILHREDLLTAALLILVALVTGHLTARLREKVDALEISSRWSREQMAMARRLSSCVSANDLIEVFAAQLREGFNTEVRQQTPPFESVPPVEGDAVRIASDEEGVRILFCDRQAVRGVLSLPLTTGLDAVRRLQLDAYSELARLAWSRVLLVESLGQETLVKEREQLRSALLSSISHDLRTPLAAMIGSVSTLIDLHDSLSASQKDELLSNTLSEARRLDRYIQKLLDMTKLGQGELKLERDWIGIDDILNVVIRRARPLLSEHQRIDVELADEMPLLYVHAALLEQAIFNVLENAIRFSPPDGEISLSVALRDARLEIDIRDQGPGMPEALWSQIFDMFFTLSQGDQQSGGTGLGLAICQGILGAHGGQARVLSSSPEHGTVLRLTLPLDKAQPGGGT
ncbi:MAG: DUF4118 domain-containing protein [Oceanospirillales bacterium]|nr:DUF4118 domain-containing protein [Oceanospirillales bacterium]